jgi:F-type H+-transporting ATPase subunit b
VAAAVLVAGDALASEGGLQIFPTLETLPLLLSLVAIFVVLILVVPPLLFRPIFAALDSREERIAGTRRRADQLATQAADALARYQASVRDARAEAESGRRTQLDAARSEAVAQLAAVRGEAEGEIERARGEIAAELERARAVLREQARELAREAAARVLGRALA